jgi:hypothetical protein
VQLDVSLPWGLFQPIERAIYLAYPIGVEGVFKTCGCSIETGVLRQPFRKAVVKST